MPSLRALRTFQVAARALSFKQAAEQMHLTASAISHQMKALERELGVRLFERGVRALRLTDAGEIYLAQVEEIFGKLETVTQQLRERFGRAILRLAVPSYFAHELLLPRLAEFSRRHGDAHRGPDIRIDTTSRPAEPLGPEADLAIVVGNGPWDDLRVLPLFEQRYVAVCAPGLLAQGPIDSVRDLQRHTLLVPEQRRDIWDSWAAGQGIEPPRPARLVRLDGMAAVVRAAEQGVGVALIPAGFGAQRFQSGALRRLFGGEFGTGERYVLLYRRTDAGRVELRELAEWIVSIAPALDT